MKKIIHIFLFFTSSVIFAQGAKVKIEAYSSEKEILKDKILKEISLKTKQLYSDIKKVDYDKVYLFNPNSSNKEEAEKKLKEIKKRKKLINSINYYDKAIEIDKLYRSIGKNGTLVKQYKIDFHKYDEIENLIIEDLDKKKTIDREDRERKLERINKEKKLEKELVAINNMTDLSKNLKKTKELSLNDFLAENNIIKERSTENIDFLDNESNNQEEDFLTINKKGDYMIRFKNSKYGIIDKEGNILIPFRFNKIIEYYDGIAKVSKTLESISIDRGNYAKCNIPLSVNVSEIGFVDKTGAYITKPNNKIRVTYSSGTCLNVVSRNDKRTHTERSKDRELAMRKRNLFFKRQIIEAKNKLISKYNIE